MRIYFIFWFLIIFKSLFACFFYRKSRAYSPLFSRKAEINSHSKFLSNIILSDVRQVRQKQEGKLSEMNTETIIVLRSVTHSFKAKKVLMANGINARAVKPPPQNGKGCAYGIALASTLAERAEEILLKNNVPIVKLIR